MKMWLFKSLATPGLVFENVSVRQLFRSYNTTNLNNATRSFTRWAKGCVLKRAYLQKNINGVRILYGARAANFGCGGSVLQFCDNSTQCDRSLGSVTPYPNSHRLFCTNSGNFQKMDGDHSTDRDVRQRIVLGQMVDAKLDTDKQEEQSSQTKTSDDSQRKAKALWWTKFSLVTFSGVLIGCASYLILLWGPPDRDEYGAEVKDEFSEKPFIVSHVQRAAKKINIEIEETQAPSREKLLPEPLQEPYYQPPYTLVIEMTDILVHPEYDWHTGWRFKKRPGVDYFLQQVGPPLFEIVIYTAEGGQTAWPVLDSLDPNGFIMYRLFRDATRYLKGKHYKDLSCLNRDLSKVIAVDWSADAMSLNKENALVVKRWHGQNEDVQLWQLATFLRTIATSGVEDVRPVLEHYSTEDDPIEAFTINQQRLQEEEARKLAEKIDSGGGVGGGGFVSSWRPGLFSRH